MEGVRLLLLLGVLRLVGLGGLLGVGREVGDVVVGGGAGAAVGVDWGEGGVGAGTAGGVRVEVWHRFALDGVVVGRLGHHGVRGEREREVEGLSGCVEVLSSMWNVETAFFVEGFFRGFFQGMLEGRRSLFEARRRWWCWCYRETALVLRCTSDNWTC